MKTENKEEKFRRIATARTNRVLNDIRLLGNCSNSNNYSYTEADINRIFNEINKELKRIRALFEKSDKNKFSL